MAADGPLILPGDQLANITEEILRLGVLVCQDCHVLAALTFASTAASSLPVIAATAGLRVLDPFALDPAQQQ
jgi:hypothetical protein